MTSEEQVLDAKLAALHTSMMQAYGQQRINLRSDKLSSKEWSDWCRSLLSEEYETYKELIIKQ